MAHNNKWIYERVIQQNFGQGWEDVSTYDVNSQYAFKVPEERKGFTNDMREYIRMGYPTRSINRKTLKENYDKLDSALQVQPIVEPKTKNGTQRSPFGIGS